MSSIRQRNEYLHTIMKRMIEHNKNQIVYEHALKNVGVEARRHEIGLEIQVVNVLIDFHYYLLHNGVEHEYELDHTPYSFYVYIYVDGIVFHARQFCFQQYYGE